MSCNTTPYNICSKRGDSFDGREFSLSVAAGYTNLASFPVVGTVGIIYKALDTGIYYEWDGVDYVVTLTRTYIDLTGCSLLMQLRQKAYITPVLSLTDGAGLTITDAAMGQFSIDEQVIELPAYIYLYDIQVTFPTGKVKTYIYGTFTIVEDVSRV